MQYHIQTLVKHLFDKESFEQVSVQELKQFADAYPYAAVGQFLYAKKLKEANAYNQHEQGEHASLYFGNALWLRFLLNKKDEAPALPARQEEAQPVFRMVSSPTQTEEAPAVAEVPVTTAPVEEPVVAAIQEQAAPVETAPAIQEPVTAAVAEQKETPATSLPEVASAVAIAETRLVDEHTAPLNAVSITEEALAPTATTIPETIVNEPVVTDAIPEPVAVEPLAVVEPVAETVVVAETPVQAAAEPVAAVIEEPVIPEQPVAAATESIPAELLVAEEEQLPLPAQEAVVTATAPVVEQVEPPQPVVAEIPAEQPEPEEVEPVNMEIKAAIDLGEPIFESYHTIDYFASQGIKLGQEDFKDRLGKQLKSFTEWLRSMKRIGPIETHTSLDDITNQSIQRIAEHSVEAKEIVTEAMAEVWVKQGHVPRAIQVYEKLSLLNPAKSPYFAGRIEQLKAL